MSNSRITYTPRPDATPEGELNTLASVYHFILDCHAKKEAAPRQSRPDAEERSKNDSSPKLSIHDE